MEQQNKKHGHKVAITNCPLWTNQTPHYAIALLEAFAKKEGLDVTAPELEIKFYHHVSDEERKYWLPVNGSFWDSDSFPNDMFDKYKESFFVPFLERIIADGTTVLALSVNNRALHMTRRLVGLAKEISPELTVILGGPTSFSAPQLLWDMQGVDAVCLGEGELSLVKFIRHLEAHGRPEEMDGFAIKKADGTIANGGVSKVVHDLNELPFPDYSGYSLDLYSTRDTIPTAISRGCIQRCSYCAESPLFGKYRSRSGKNIYDEIRFHQDKLKLEKVQLLFNDSLINGDIGALEEFADEIISSGISITYGGMAIARKEMTPDLLAKLRKSGCADLSFGIESGSQEVLRMMRKRLHTPESSEIVLKNTKEAGISTTVFIILGFPGETERHFYETLEFLRRNIDNIDNLMVNVMLILNGSFLQKNPQEYGIDTAYPLGGQFRTLDGSNTPDIRKTRQKVLYLLFQKKMSLLGELDDGYYNPIKRLDSEIDSQKNGLAQAMAEREMLQELLAQPSPHRYTEKQVEAFNYLLSIANRHTRLLSFAKAVYRLLRGKYSKDEVKEHFKNFLRTVHLYNFALKVKHLLIGTPEQRKHRMIKKRRKMLGDRFNNARINAKEIKEKKDYLESYPRWVITEVTKRCNLECRMCYRYQQNFVGEDISDELFDKLKKEFFPLAITISFSGSGEPLMYRRWDELVEEVKKWDFIPQINTNGTLFTEDRARAVVDANFRVDFSIDGATEETYKYIRGASFKVIARNIERMRDHKIRTGNKKFEMFLIFTPQVPNLKELPRLVDLAREWGMSRIVVQPWNPNVPNQTLSPDHAKELANEVYLKARDKARTYGIPIQLPGFYKIDGDGGEKMEETSGKSENVVKPKEEKIGEGAEGCLFPFNTVYVWQDGEVYPCCFGMPSYGNLIYQDFEDIWNGEKWRQLRRELIEGNFNDVCKRCYHKGTLIS